MPEDWDAGSDEETAELLRRAVSAVNGALSPYERIRDFRVVSEGFSEQRGEVGASGQPRRHVVLERYAALVEQMYVENAKPTARRPGR